MSVFTPRNMNFSASILSGIADRKTLLTGTGVFVVPDGVTEISAYLSGGGGSGGPLSGGDSGNINIQVISVSPGDELAYSCGAGGYSQYTGGQGVPGGTTTFAWFTATGGLSGTYDPYFTAGSGGSGINGCGGHGGYANSQSDFSGPTPASGNGGSAFGRDGGGGGSIMGAGGGGGGKPGGLGAGGGGSYGTGGDGFILVSW